MARIEITNRNFAEQLACVSAGDEVVLVTDDDKDKANFLEPIILDGKHGTQQRPIIIRPDTGKTITFKSDYSEHQARLWLNKVADRRQRGGYYPSVGQLGDQASLILRNCQYVVIQGFDFEDCWPGAIYLDECQYIAIHDIDFRRGTIAIGVNGLNSHDIIVQHCHWQQDTSDTNKMWSEVPWGRIHGASDNSQDGGSVDLDDDFRHWDGDFFRAWDVAGNIIIRQNTITDAFNGIHFFNRIDQLPPGRDALSLPFNDGRRSSANVLIEKNTFVRVRDNIFEPEGYGWNWVIRHNELKDCYRPFSFEFERAGWIYVYGNKGAFLKKPSTKLSDADQEKFKDELRQSSSLFKPKGTQANEGPIFVAYNSWYFESGKGILPKFSLGNLVHANNAIEFKKPSKGRLFGNGGHMPSSIPFDLEAEEMDEQQRFTRRWRDYNIKMDGDLTNDALYPVGYRMLGYAIGGKASQLGKNEIFERPDNEADLDKFLALKDKAKKEETVALVLELPDGETKELAGGLEPGAVQPQPLYDLVDSYFKFLPSDDWVPQLPEPRERNPVV